MAAISRNRQRRFRVRALLLPHEHDESPELRRAPSPAIAQAATDVAAGMVDTDNYTRAEQASGLNTRRRPGPR